MNEIKTAEKIKALIKKDLKVLDHKLKKWAESQRIEPKKELLSINREGTSSKEFWIVTNGKNCPYRIAYDQEKDSFGLECKLENGVKWFMGHDNSFAEAVQNI